uniref:Uncharacterized protein n=1 Tax=Rhizophora mucronata TaxID=61149 RepID=A0A2P2P1T2_RHIMU
MFCGGFVFILHLALMSMFGEIIEVCIAGLMLIVLESFVCRINLLEICKKSGIGWHCGKYHLRHCYPDSALQFFLCAQNFLNLSIQLILCVYLFL